KETLKIISIITLLFFAAFLPVGPVIGNEPDGPYFGADASYSFTSERDREGQPLESADASEDAEDVEDVEDVNEETQGPAEIVNEGAYEDFAGEPAANPDPEISADETTAPVDKPEISTGQNKEEPLFDEGPSADFDGYLVKLKPGARQPRMMTLMSTDAVEQVSDGLYLVDSLEQAANLAPEAYIEYIEPNYYMQLFDEPIPPPDDPMYGAQWDLPIINFDAAWQEELSGAGVRIAVLDSGIAATHEDVEYSLIEWYDAVTPANAALGDTIGHGTQVTGIINAIANNTLGLTGIAPGAEIIAVKVTQDATIKVSDVITALDWLLGLKEPTGSPAYGIPKCDIINMSFGQAGTPTSFPSLEAAVERVAAAGVVMVAAAGNNGDTGNASNYPAAYSNVISVGALDGDKVILPSSTHRSSVNLAAPGAAVPTLDIDENVTYSGYYDTASGTSMSAPIVTAAAALLKEKIPSLTSSELQNLLQETAEDLGAAGKDNYYGYGLIDLGKALEEINAVYNIEFEPYWGSFPGNITVPSAYQRFDGEITLPEPVFPGFSFDGWYEDEDFTGDPVDTLYRSRDDKKFYAQWAVADPAILDLTVLNVGAVAAQLINDTEYSAVLPSGSSLPSAASLSIELNYGSDGASYEITEAAPFNGSEWNIEVEYGPASKTYQLHVSLKPSGGGGGGGGGGGSTTVVNPSRFTVTFNTQNGSVIQPVTVNTGSLLSAPPEPLRAGYLFTGWFIDADGTDAWDFGKNTVTKDLVLYAVWSTETKPVPDDEDEESEDNDETGGTSPGTQAPPYSPEYNPAAPYMSGYPDGTFAPEQGMTRAEIAVIFWHLMGNAQQPLEPAASFTDVFPGDWYYEAVTAMKNNRIINGYPDHTYNPGQIATRAEFSIMVSNFFHLEPAGDEVLFPDVPADYWGAPYINSVAGQKWFRGFDDGLFYPSLDLTRAQAAVIMNRALNRPVTAEIPSDAPHFTDLDSSNWAYYDIIAATTSHYAVNKN
ncbi:MAG: S8 family serine peptidase, partial [Syntrophomonadaceae bacterium]|nr:S8 family serine peptidase [Syntrophomonadaceae bacterium]